MSSVLVLPELNFVFTVVIIVPELPFEVNENIQNRVCPGCKVFIRRTDNLQMAMNGIQKDFIKSFCKYHIFFKKSFKKVLTLSITDAIV